MAPAGRVEQRRRARTVVLSMLLVVGLSACQSTGGPTDERRVDEPSVSSSTIGADPADSLHGAEVTAPSAGNVTTTGATAAQPSGPTTATGTSNALGQEVEPPIVIGHRGASAYRPENTLSAFALAMDLGADYVEPDIVLTRDGHAIVRHDNELSLTTDVALRPEFAEKRTTKLVDGKELTGWFSEDFTLAEIQTLRAVERLPDVRPESARFDGEEGIPTLREVLDLVVTTNELESSDVGVYPELKHPSYFESLGLDIGTTVLADLREFGFEGPGDKALIQSFEVGVLRTLHDETGLGLVQLLGGEAPFDQLVAGTGLTFSEMATPAGLAEIAEYADVVAVEKNRFIIPLNGAGDLDETAATSFVDDAHDASLFVHAYTFRAENEFLPANLRSGADPNAGGDLAAEIDAFRRVGVDGFITDHVDVVRSALPSG